MVLIDFFNGLRESHGLRECHRPRPRLHGIHGMANQSIGGTIEDASTKSCAPRRWMMWMGCRKRWMGWREIHRFNHMKTLVFLDPNNPMVK